MIAISIDSSGLTTALDQLSAALERNVRDAFEMTLESIAVRAKGTHSFVDRTGALRNSIQSEGVQGSLDGPEGLVGTVSYAATSERRSGRSRRGRRRRSSGGEFYGVFLEYGTRHIKERRFIRDAIDAETGDIIEDAVGASFRLVGFEVVA